MISNMYAYYFVYAGESRSVIYLRSFGQMYKMQQTLCQ